MSNYFDINATEQKVNVTAGEARNITYTVTNKTDSVQMCCSDIKFLSGKHIPYKVNGPTSVKLNPGETAKINVVLFPSSLLNSCVSEFQLIFYSEDLPDEIYTKSTVVRLEITGIEKNEKEDLTKLLIIIGAILGVILIGLGVFLSVKAYKNHKEEQFKKNFINLVYLEGTVPKRKRDIGYWKSDIDRIQFFQSIYNTYVLDENEEVTNNLITIVLNNDNRKRANKETNKTYKEIYKKEIIDLVMSNMIKNTLLCFNNIYNPQLLIEIFYRITTPTGSPAFNLNKIEDEINNQFGEKFNLISFNHETIDVASELEGFSKNEVIDNLESMSKYVSLYYNHDRAHNFWSCDFQEISSVDKIVLSDNLESYDNALKESISKKISELDKFYFSEKELTSINTDFQELLNIIPYAFEGIISLASSGRSIESKLLETDKLIKNLNKLIELYFKLEQKANKQREIIGYLTSLFEGIKIDGINLKQISYLDIDKSLYNRLNKLLTTTQKLSDYYKALISKGTVINEKEVISIIEYISKYGVNELIDDNFVNNLILLRNINVINFNKQITPDNKTKLYDSIERLEPLSEIDSTKYMINYVDGFEVLIRSDNNIDKIIQTRNVLHNYLMNNYDSLISSRTPELLQSLVADMTENNLTNITPTLDIELRNFTVTLYNSKNKVAWSTYIKSKPRGSLTLIPDETLKDIKSIKIELHHEDYLQISDLKVYKKVVDPVSGTNDG